MQDVVIIGGGAVGCAVARELSRWQLDVCLVEQGEDVCVLSLIHISEPTRRS